MVITRCLLLLTALLKIDIFVNVYQLDTTISSLRCGIFAGGVFKGTSGVELPNYFKILSTLQFSSLGVNFRPRDSWMIAGRRVWRRKKGEWKDNETGG